MKHIKLFEDFKPGKVLKPQMATSVEQCKNALSRNIDKVSDKKVALNKEREKIKNDTRMPDSEKKLWYAAIDSLS